MTNDFSLRIQVLEEKFAFQEQTTDALNDVILDQQTQINELQEQLHKIIISLNSDQQQAGEEKDPPPPHY